VIKFTCIKKDIYKRILACDLSSLVLRMIFVRGYYPVIKFTCIKKDIYKRILACD
jgi:hypothetical protein